MLDTKVGRVLGIWVGTQRITARTFETWERFKAEVVSNSSTILRGR